MSSFKDYIAILPIVIAIINGFIAVLVAQLFKDNPRAKVRLLVIAGLLAVTAIGATIFSQREFLIARSEQAVKSKKIRGQLAELISEGLALMKGCTDYSKPAPSSELNDWLNRVRNFLETELDHSYAVRIDDPAGIPPNIGCSGANPEYNSVVRIIYGVNFHLEQFSQQASF